jgi:alpha/beta superfamily hydrolase
VKRKMAGEKIIRFPSEEVALVGGLTVTDPSAPSVVICHPHPDYGGSMENNVVYAVRDAVVSLGFSALRFNFRGVGGSGGLSAGTLIDVRDVRAAVDFIEKTEEITSPAVYLVGYSYGAWVGLSHAVTDERIAGWVGISPPTTLFDFSFLIGSPAPKLIVCGDVDSFLSLPDVTSLFEQLPEPKEFVVIPGADHFYWGFEEALARMVGTFFQKINAAE